MATLNLPTLTVYVGCDPEVFLVSKTTKRTIGSELVLPKEGLNHYSCPVVCDGVQVELHPLAETCRANVGNSIQAGFQALKEFLDLNHPSVEVSFEQVKRIGKVVLSKLGMHARTLGCTPSLNIYGRPPAKVDGGVYLLRSAAGHIHLGNDEIKKGKINVDQLVRLLDVVVGNTFVLIDRDPNAAVRRELYGKAGEYRLPKHGLEYRTPSNAWLRNYRLWSLISALSRTCVRLAHASNCVTKTYGATFDLSAGQRILDAAPAEEVQLAINNNDIKLATQIYQCAVRPVLSNLALGEGIDHDTADAFDFFIQKGLDFWFEKDALTHWVNKREGHGFGWESFCDSAVKPAMKAAVAKAAKNAKPETTQINTVAAPVRV